MITIIHGDDIVSSRKHYIAEREKHAGSLVFDGENLSMQDLIQNLEGSLFGQQRTIFIEHLLVRRGKEQEEIIVYIKKQDAWDFVFWEGKELDKKSQILFPGANIVAYSFPKTLFSFLETLRPGNGKTIMLMFHKLLVQTEAELIFFMIIRQFRLLLAVSQIDPGSQPHSDPGSELQIDEVKRLAPWQKERVQRQSSLFSYDKLKKIYQRLFEIDVSHKTGKTALTLSQSIDIFLLNL